MVAEISRRKRGEKFIVADFFLITNFRLWLLKFQEEKRGKNVLLLIFFL